MNTARALQPAPPRRLWFEARLARMRSLVGYGADDVALVAASRETVRGRVSEIEGRILTRLLAHDETAAYFDRAADERDESAGEIRRQALRDWIGTVLTCDADPAVAESVAVLARAYTRRGGGVSTQLKGRYFVAVAAMLLEEVSATLAAGRKATVDHRPIAAWGKLVALHLDTLLAVLDSAERGRQWY